MPLHIATEHGHTKTVSILIEKGAKLNEKSKRGNTSLHDAVIQEHTDIVNILVNAGTRKNIKNNDGRTSLYLAQTEAIKALLK